MPLPPNGGKAYRVYPVRVCVCVCLCVPDSSPTPYLIVYIVGFKTYSAEIIIRTRQCVAWKSHVYRSKVKVIVGT